MLSRQGHKYARSTRNKGFTSLARHGRTTNLQQIYWIFLVTRISSVIRMTKIPVSVAMLSCRPQLAGEHRAIWIGETKKAEHLERELDLAKEETIEPSETTPCIAARLSTWKSITLKILFRSATKPRTRKPSAHVMQEEEMLMQALAEEAEDAIPDDGAIEIHSENEYRG
jgi:hypothetical protein